MFDTKLNGLLPFLPHVQSQFGGMPVGSVVAFAGEFRQQGKSGDHQTNLDLFPWLLCNGEAYAASEYPELFNVLGHRYGGSGDSFNVPDYRGQFLRCVDESPTSASNDGRQGPKGSVSSNEVGSTQKHALEDHQHQYFKPLKKVVVSADKPSGLAASELIDETKWGPKRPSISSKETRPTNTYVYYIIKAR